MPDPVIRYIPVICCKLCPRYDLERGKLICKLTQMEVTNSQKIAPWCPLPELQEEDEGG